MNTTTNTRGVSEAMVERAKQGWRNSIETDGQGASFDTRLRATIEAALSAPEPAAQGEEVPVAFLNTKYRTLFHASEIGCAERNAELIASGELVRLYTAPPAQPAERVPEGWVLVPREPTEAMVAASMIRVEVPRKGTLSVLGARAWEAMLAASPAPSQPAEHVPVPRLMRKEDGPDYVKPEMQAAWRDGWNSARTWVLTASPAPSEGEKGVDGCYLACFKHGGHGYLLWWGPNNCGYTTDLEQAGIYPADEIKPGYHDNEYTVPVPVALVDRFRIRRMLDLDDSLNDPLRSAEALRAWLALAKFHPTHQEKP